MLPATQHILTFPAETRNKLKDQMQEDAERNPDK